MVTAVNAATALVLTVNVALVAPATTVTLEGTVAAAVLLLESATCTPPAGAAPLNVTVPVENFAPPTTLVGFSVSEERVGAGGGAGASGRNRHAGRHPGGRRITAGERNLRSACGSCSAQRHRPGGGLCAANNARRTQRQRGKGEGGRN